MLRCLLLLLFLFISNLLSVENSKNIVKEIKLVNLTAISSYNLKNMLSIKIGDNITQKSLNRDIKTLYLSKYFKSIKASYKNNILTLSFLERKIIAKIVVNGIFEDEDDEARAIVFKGLKVGDYYDQSTLNIVINRMKQYLIATSKINSYIDVKTTLNINGFYILTFNVIEGRGLKIDKLTFIGREKVSSFDIEKSLLNVNYNSILSYLKGYKGNNDLKLFSLYQDRAVIRDVYFNSGYLDMEISKPFVLADFTDFNVDLRYIISEGEQYSIKDFKVNSVSNKYRKEISKLIDIKKGSVYNQLKVKKIVNKIKSFLYEKGYAYAKVDFKLTDKDSLEKSVYVTFNVNEGKKVYIRDVLIEGDEKSSDIIVRRELLVYPGDLYSKKNINNSKFLLNKTGYFDKVVIDEIRVDDKSMNIIVHVHERRTGRYQVGISYSSDNGFGINMSVKDKNTFGSGKSVGVSFDLGTTNNNINLSLYNPRLFNSRYSLNTSVYYSTNNNFDDFDLTSYGLNIGSSRTFNLKHTLGLNLGIGGYQYSDINSSSSDSALFQNYTKIFLKPYYYYYNVDNSFFPHNGVTFNISFEIPYVVVEDEPEGFFYSKVSTTIKGFLKVPNFLNKNTVLRDKINASYIINPANHAVPYAENFFMGGASDLRGYSIDSISPRDIDNRDIGSDAKFINSLEIAFPLNSTSTFRLVLFYDIGLLNGRNDESGIYNDIIFKQSAGLQIEWISPLGPLKFIIPAPINPAPEDDVQYFQFAVGGAI